MIRYIKRYAAAITLGLACQVSAATVLVDFGRTDNRTSGTQTYNNIAIANGGSYPSGTAYNFSNATFLPLSFVHETSGSNISSGTITGTVSTANLLDTSGSASGISISFQGRSQGTTGQVGTAGVGGEYAGTYGSAPTTSLFAAASLTDSLFINNAGVLRVTISGLSDSLQYDLSAFSGRSGTSSAFSGGYWNLITGTSSTQQVYLDGASSPTPLVNNTTLVDPTGTNGGDLVQFLGVSPTGGTIAFDLRTQNFPGNAIAALNSISITAIPEPSSVLFIASAFSGLILMQRFRRK